MPEHTYFTRRSVLRYFTISLSAVTAFIAAWGVGKFALYSSGGVRSREIPPDVLSKLAPDAPLHVPEAGAWIVTRQTDGGLSALDDRCTHLGCRQKWNPARQLFECPCHGSEFDVEGNVKRGPAARSLPKLYIATGKDEKLHLSEKPPTGTPSS